MTRSEFKKIVPFYLGKKVLVKKTKEVTTLYGIVEGGISTNNPIHSILGYGDFKLILRPYYRNELTDGEIEVIQELRSDIFLNIESSFEHWKYQMKTSTNLINYLRSIGIDCDGLIESGFAITNTK